MIKYALPAILAVAGCSSTPPDPTPSLPAVALGNGALNWRGKRWPAWIYIDAGAVPVVTVRSGDLSWKVAGCSIETVNGGEANCSGLVQGIDGDEVALIWMDVYGNIQIGTPTLQVDGRAQVKCWREPADGECTPWTRDVRDEGEDG